MPVHLFVEGRYCAGTWSWTVLLMSVKRPAFSTCVMAGEFSVRKTSAGDLAPSAMIWLLSSRSSPLRTVTLMPVSLVNSSTQACVSDSCWALYTVMASVDPPAAPELCAGAVAPPQAARARTEAPARAASEVLLKVFLVNQ